MLSNGHYFYTGGRDRRAEKHTWEIGVEAGTVIEHAPMNEGRCQHAI